MASTIYPRKVEMDVTYVKPAPAGAAFRLTDGFLELKDSATAEFSKLWLASGVLQIGEGEE